MKIANKIFVLVLFLIAALGVNTYISLCQVSSLGEKLREITDKNIVLSDVGNTVTQRYLENAIRFQAMLNAGDELAFAEMPASRRQYLISHINNIKQGFDRLTQETGEAVIKGKELIAHKLQGASHPAQAEELKQAGQLLEKIETAYVEYDKLFNDIFKMIGAGNYELSLEDLGRINQKEKLLAQKIKSLLEEIRQSTQKTLNNAARQEQKARETLVLALQCIIFVSMLTSFFIIRSFSSPLKKLVYAAHEIGVGNFKVELDTDRRDEIGEVSTAFNKMTGQLDEFKTKLEEQNQVLGKNLQITKEQKQDIEKVNTELDRFVYTVSHDIAAPLTGIEGYGDFLEKHYFDKLDEKGQRSLTGLRRATKRMTMMIKDLLALTRITRIKNPYEKVDIRLLLDVVLERLEYVIREADAKIVLMSPLPNVVCDRVKITEVFDNLINNAVKFSASYQKGKWATPTVEIGYAEREDCFQFYVRDNGIGIPPENREDIFNLFKRLDNAIDYEGTGAGLSIVKAGVEDHGGKVWVEANQHEGSTFYFTIPKGLKATLSKLVAS
ncbi:MAG: HAMP domain-containing protein [Candidatus Omnitrophica bacterium]|nr:HAMP domain-containing protein [Candidatus Omnitrophota bacterium]